MLFPQHICGVSSVRILASILKIGRTEGQKGEWFAQGWKSSKHESWDSSSDSLTPNPQLFPPDPSGPGAAFPWPLGK